MAENDGKNEPKAPPLDEATKGAPTESAAGEFKFENIDGSVEQLKLNDGWLIGGSGGSGYSTGCGFACKGGIGKAREDIAESDKADETSGSKPKT